MKKTVSLLLAITLVSSVSFATQSEKRRSVPVIPVSSDLQDNYALKRDVSILARNIEETAVYGQLTAEQLLKAKEGLQLVLREMKNRSANPSFLCLKQNNGLIYPVNSETGSVIGSTSYSAGYSSPQECAETLPSPYDSFGCFKQNNGLFYITRLETMSVFGSTSYSAGISTIQECRSYLPRPGATLICMKQNNGLFYPTKASDGSVFGSTSYSAGYSEVKDCNAAIGVR